MGYKRIDAAIHNFAHSFVSLMNYVDGEYIIDLLPRLLRETPGHEIRLSLTSPDISPQVDYHPTFLKSVDYYRNRVRDHLASEDVDASILQSFDFVLFADTNGLICQAVATDDRGVKHTSAVRPE